MKKYVIKKSDMYLTEVARKDDDSQSEYLWTVDLGMANRFSHDEAMQQVDFLTFSLLGVEYTAEAVEVLK